MGSVRTDLPLKSDNRGMSPMPLSRSRLSRPSRASLTGSARRRGGSIRSRSLSRSCGPPRSEYRPGSRTRGSSVRRSGFNKSRFLSRKLPPRRSPLLSSDLGGKWRSPLPGKGTSGRLGSPEGGLSSATPEDTALPLSVRGDGAEWASEVVEAFGVLARPKISSRAAKEVFPTAATTLC